MKRPSIVDYPSFWFFAGGFFLSLVTLIVVKFL